MFHDQQIFLFQLAFGPRNGAFWQGKWTCRLLFFSGECARMAVGISRNAGRFSACPAREENTINGSVSKLYDIDSIAIPAELLALCVDEQQVEQSVRQPALRYASEAPADAVQPGDVVRCRADAASYPDGRTILLFPGMALPGAEAAEQAVLGRGVGDEFSAPLCGRNAVLTVEGITRRTPTRCWS